MTINNSPDIKFDLEPAPHIHSRMTTSKMMGIVLGALIPAYCVMIYFFGYGVLIQFLICAISCCVAESIAALLRKRKPVFYITDLSALVTAAILGLTLPAFLPWYLSVSASFFAILLVKHTFGGLGMNIFNPAMAGFIFLIISAPGIFFSTWVSPAPGAYSIATIEQSSDVIFSDKDPIMLRNKIKELNTNADILTGATYLESIKTARKAGAVGNVETIDFSLDSYKAYGYLAIAYLLGGIILIGFKVIPFQMPLSFLATIFIGGSIWHALDPGMSINGIEHILFGGTMLGAFFIITDPVTNSGTFKGRICFAIFTGLLVLLIRVQGSYSDSVAFAVMLANAAAPLLDVLTRRRPFGIGYRKGGLD